MDRSVHNQALALAGLMHATSLVRQIAREGRIDDDELAAALEPVFALDPGDVDAVYASTTWRQRAPPVLRAQLGVSGNSRDIEATRYAATLMHIERKLAAREDMRSELRDGLENSARQLEHFAVTHRNVIGGLGELYGRTISKLRPRVIVQGDATHLEDGQNADRVRALLLAGLRSAVLWRQSGGSRLKLILGRGRLLSAARALDAPTHG